MSAAPFATRRRLLSMGAVAAAGQVFAGCARHSDLPAPVPPAPAIHPQHAPESATLTSCAAAQGFLFGCAVDVRALITDEAYTRLVREQAGILVAENAMKWEPMRPGIDRFYFDQADALVAFAEANKMKVRGHTLCWHRQLPEWFAAEATAGNARDLLKTHIETVAGRYAGRMHSWDVVNEAVMVPDGRPDGLRESPWLKLIGEGYIELAFRIARDADPQALLTYNDYGIEGESAAAQKKRAAVLVLLRRLKTRHVPLDALGIQSHLSAGQSFGAGLRSFLAEVRELGLQIFLTEMDVNDRELPADKLVRDRIVAATYGSYLDLALEEPALRAVLTWGITDRKTWLNGEDARPDHLPERCLPFGVVDGVPDRPKEAFFAMRKAFSGRKTQVAHLRLSSRKDEPGEIGNG